MLNRTWNVPRRNLLAAAVLAALLACGGDTEPEPNRAPTVTNAIPDQLMTEGDTVTIDLSSYFSDPDGDALTYTATSSDPGVLSASVSGSELTLVAVAPGEASVTVTATDTDGLKATDEFDATVKHRNRAPMLTDSIPAQVVVEGRSITIDLAPHFDDPDGDTLMYGAVSSDGELLAVEVSENELVLAGLRAGTVTVTVTATDPDGLSASQDLDAVIEMNHAPEVVEEIGDIGLEQDEYVVFDLSSHFSDANGDSLTYTAVSSDTLVVSTSFDGDTLKVSSLAPGGASVKVTATDPSGLSADQTAEVEVDEGFSVDFTDLDTLLHWRLESVSTELSDDGLRVSLESGDCGHAFKQVRSELSEWWKMSAEIGREDSLAVSYVMVRTDHARYQGYRLLIGSGMFRGGQSLNYRLDEFDTNFRVFVPFKWGFSDELDDLGYDLNEVTLEYSASSDTLVARVDTLELLALELTEENRPTAVATGDAGFGVCSLSGGANGETVLVESGYLEGGRGNARRGDLENGSAIKGISETVRLGILPSIPVIIHRKGPESGPAGSPLPSMGLRWVSAPRDGQTRPWQIRQDQVWDGSRAPTVARPAGGRPKRR